MGLSVNVGSLLVPLGGEATASSGAEGIAKRIRKEGGCHAWTGRPCSDASSGWVPDGSAPRARAALPWRALAAVRITGLCLAVVFAVSMAAAAPAATAAGDTVAAWGYNGNGELGNGTKTESDGPVAVSELGEVAAIAAGGRVTASGCWSNTTVMAWGAPEHGQLGDGTMTGPGKCGLEACSDVPVAVSGLSGVTAIAAGETHSLALLSNGTVMAWGSNEYGQLGNGSEANSDVPVAVSLALPPGVTVTAVWAGFALQPGAAEQRHGHGLGRETNGASWATAPKETTATCRWR